MIGGVLRYNMDGYGSIPPAFRQLGDPDGWCHALPVTGVRVQPISIPPRSREQAASFIADVRDFDMTPQ